MAEGAATVHRFYASNMAVAAPRPTILQQARRAQMLTIGWMVIEAAIAIVAGLVAHSVALTAFGVDSGVELFSSVVVLNRLMQRSESEERGSLSGGERRASRLVGYALYGLMAGLWRWRLGLADRLGSPALRGDAACSMVCLYMAAVALVGLVLNQLFGLWWADPLAAVALVWWIRGEAREAVEAGRI